MRNTIHTIVSIIALGLLLFGIVSLAACAPVDVVGPDTVGVPSSVHVEKYEDVSKGTTCYIATSPVGIGIDCVEW